MQGETRLILSLFSSSECEICKEAKTLQTVLHVTADGAFLPDLDTMSFIPNLYIMGPVFRMLVKFH